MRKIIVRNFTFRNFRVIGNYGDSEESDGRKT